MSDKDASMSNNSNIIRYDVLCPFGVEELCREIKE